MSRRCGLGVGVGVGVGSGSGLGLGLGLGLGSGLGSGLGHLANPNLHPDQVWPGPFLPTLRMSRTNGLALALRASALLPPEHLPPIFRRCSARLRPEDEEAA